MDGISYFCSTLEFGVLNDDLTAVTDTRWWVAEVARLQEGIAAQLRRLRRDTGSVRLLYHPASNAGAAWSQALNRANIPYRWLSRQELAAGLDVGIGLLLCPEATALTEPEVAALERFAAGGGTLVATGGFGVESGALAARLAALQGIAPRTIADWPQQHERFAGIPATLAGATRTFEGTANGEVGWTPDGAEIAARFTRLGIAETPAQAPAHVQRLFANAAMLRHAVGAGQVWSLAFQPSAESMAPLLQSWGAEASPARVTTVAGQPAEAVYLYPMGDGPLRVWGVVQDYWRVKPAELLDDAPSPTQASVLHGRSRWATQPARLTLPAAGHLYDVRQGRYLGHGATVDFALTPGRPELFALLPYQVQALLIEAPTTATAGDAWSLRLRLAAAGATPGDHVVHLQAPELTAAIDLLLPGGEGTVTLPIPLNASGTLTLRVRDALTGVAATHQVAITPRPLAAPLPPREEIVVRDLIGELPPGGWQPWREPATPTDVTASVNALNRAPLFHGDHKGQWHLRGGFTLRNAATTWRATYQVCDDYEANKKKWPDPRFIAAPYLPGLGFTQPASHTWYYNGYLEVFCDQFNATQYALTSIRQEPAGANGRIVCTWDTPIGTLELVSLLTPDSPVLFQELRLRPTRPFRQLELRFRTYPNGFGGGEPWLHEEPGARSWAIFGDRQRDRAYGQGQGPGALLLLPEEWQAWRFGTSSSLTRVVDAATAPLGVVLMDDEPAADPLLTDLAPAAKPAQLPELRARWALWLMPEMGNDEFLAYLQTHAAEGRTRLRQLFPDTPHDPPQEDRP